MNAILRGLLARQLEKRSRTPASVSKALGRNPSWLYRILSGERRITVDSLEAALLEIGVGLDEFFAEYLRKVCSPHLVTKSGYSEDPHLILRALRGRKDPDLDWIGEFSSDRVTPLQPGKSFSLHPLFSDSMTRANSTATPPWLMRRPGSKVCGGELSTDG